MQYFDAISKMTALSLFVYKANHSISWWSKPMSWPVTLKKPRLSVLWRPTRPFRTNTQKRCPFHYRGLEHKSRKSRNTWSNRQIWPWIMEWSKAKTNRVLLRERTGHSKHPLLDIANIIRGDSTRGHHEMVNTKITLIIFFAAKDGEALYSQQKQDQEVTVAQIMNSLLPNSDLNWRKWGKTTRPFSNDLNQIPYDYTVEVRIRFKGLDLIECLMNYGQRFVSLYRRQGSRPSPRKRIAKKQNGCLRRPYK